MIRLRLAVLLGGAMLAPACMHLNLTQDRGTAIVRVEGETDEIDLAGPIAARLLPYAVLAEQATSRCRGPARTGAYRHRFAA